MQKAHLVSKASPVESRKARIVQKARELGFDAVGVAEANAPLGADFTRYEAFVERGMHGEMQYLAEDRSVRERLDTDGILAGARSVICLARRYDRPREDEARDPPLARKIARYARGQDYHNALRKKLRKLAAFVRGLAEDGETISARPICDDVPVLERAWASRAGLGFIGKNGLLIVPGQGSFVLLGEVVTSLSLAPDTPVAERCGSCTLCLDTCPTNAFDAPRVLDPRKCISYWTIERRSALAPEESALVGEHLFGCDDCQSVCPFNAKSLAEPAGTRAEQLRVFSPHPRWGELTLGDLVASTEDTFEELSRGSPLRRATRAGLARNAAIVAGNTRDPSARAELEAAGANDPSEVVRTASSWALTVLAER